jgi:ADP-L-glycero-D-manno-heptose 6-epimerase
MQYLVTGAAGFIGSNIVRALNQRGERNIIAVDNLENSRKFSNLAGVEIADYLDKREFIERLSMGDFDGGIDVVFHEGACSNTMEMNGRYMMENNYRYSLALLDFCINEEVPLLYASSAAVYGGSRSFKELPANELPLNVYGYSKLLFDQIVRRRMDGASSQIAGFRYFNVYGQNEGHKGNMASVAWHFYHQYKSDGYVQPFAGSGGYGDGEQLRDFVSVEDVVSVNLHFLDNPQMSGVFNLGTGNAESFNSVAAAVVNACKSEEGFESMNVEELHKAGYIRYREFPETLKGKYQHFTQADISSLRSVGYDRSFLRVEEGVSRYISGLIEQP